MDLALLVRHRDRLLGCRQLLPHVREHLLLRLNLLDQPPDQAWQRLLEHGRELAGEYAFTFNTSQSDALIEASARGGPYICERALAILNDPAEEENWNPIFSVRVLGLARYEPAVDARSIHSKSIPTSWRNGESLAVAHRYAPRRRAPRRILSR